MTKSFSSSRRRLLKGALYATPVLAAPYLLGQKAAASPRLVVRSLGGAYEAAAKEHFYDPFSEETGIDIELVPATSGKLLAMLRSGNVDIDVFDIGEVEVSQFTRLDLLEPIAYDKWSSVKKEDLDSEALLEFAVGHGYYAAILGVNTAAVSADKMPRSWSDFWNAEAFPGPRMLADMASGYVDLEQALLADGVSPAQLYPLDVDRAFASLTRIRPHIRKFWDTGALSAQMLADQEAVMGTIWNTRLQAAKDGGAPLDIVWDGGLLRMQCWATAKGGPNSEHAQRFIEFALSPERQAALCARVPNGPSNKKAFDHMEPSRAALMPNSPDHRSKMIHQDVGWWLENRDTVASTWSKWLLANR